MYPARTFPQRQLGAKRTASPRFAPKPRLEHAQHGTPVEQKLAPSTLQFPCRLGSFGDRLLDQQIWCWGQDVARLDRNLLVEYGFERQRCEAAHVSTCYSAAHRDGFAVALWSWGLFFGDVRRGGAFWRRSSISPLLTPDASLPHPHWPEGVYPPHRPPQSPDEAEAALELLRGVARWIARFEEWIESQAGPEYRSGCLRDWPRRVSTGESPAELWRRLADEVARDHAIGSPAGKPETCGAAPDPGREGACGR